jgi:hypothetical protein
MESTKQQDEENSSVSSSPPPSPPILVRQNAWRPVCSVCSGGKRIYWLCTVCNYRSIVLLQLHEKIGAAKHAIAVVGKLSDMGSLGLPVDLLEIITSYVG